MFKRICLIKLAKRSISSSSNLIDFKNLDKCKPILESFHLFEDFITDKEEQTIFEQIEKQLKRRRYEDSHFDYAIYQYREIEFKNWNEHNLKIINKIKELGFSDDPSNYNLSNNNQNINYSSGKPEINVCSNKETYNETNLNVQSSNQYSNHLSNKSINLSNYSTNYDDEHIKQQSNSQQNHNLTLNNLQNKILKSEISNNTSTTNSSTNDDKLNINLDKNINKKNFSIIPEIHILDLHANGAIKPHVDAVRFCGSRIIGLSLCSDAIMRLAKVDDKDTFVDVLLKRKSLYIMRDYSRYNCTHEILGDEQSIFKNKKIPRKRRISIIARCLPEQDVKEQLN